MKNLITVFPMMMVCLLTALCVEGETIDIDALTHADGIRPRGEMQSVEWPDTLDLAARAGVDFSLNVVLNRERRVVGAYAGDLEASHETACEVVRHAACPSVTRPAARRGHDQRPVGVPDANSHAGMGRPGELVFRERRPIHCGAGQAFRPRHLNAE